MKNSKKKLLSITLLLAMIFTMLLPSIVMGNEIPDITAIKNNELSNAASNIIGIVQFVGIAVAVIMLIWYGVRYFTAAPEKQGDLKGLVWGYLIGAICIFGAVIILQFVKNTILNQNILS